MNWRRWLRHGLTTHWGVRRRFPKATLDAIEAAVRAAEKSHGGEIRFAVLAALDSADLWQDISPREQALQVFAHLRVWDTAHNNGVLIYACVADRNVEIVADRGFAGKVSAAEWEAVCRLMEEHFRAGRFREGSVAGVEAVGRLIGRHFASVARRDNELPDRPALL